MKLEILVTASKAGGGGGKKVNVIGNKHKGASQKSDNILFF